jgi:hypothetical protein
MARRIVLGRRGVSSSFGLWVSKAGFDADAAADANLVFTMTYKQGMVLDSGSVTLPSDGSQVRVSFADTYPSIPLVFCGMLRQQASTNTVSCSVDTSGFNVRADSLGNGTRPAGGKSVQWFAVMKTQN